MDESFHRVCIAKLISIAVRLKMIYINLSINHAYLHNNDSMKLISFQNNYLFKFQSVMCINQFLFYHHHCQSFIEYNLIYR